MKPVFRIPFPPSNEWSKGSENICLRSRMAMRYPNGCQPREIGYHLLKQNWYYFQYKNRNHQKGVPETLYDNVREWWATYSPGGGGGEFGNNGVSNLRKCTLSTIQKLSTYYSWLAVYGQVSKSLQGAEFVLLISDGKRYSIFSAWGTLKRTKFAPAQTSHWNKRKGIAKHQTLKVTNCCLFPRVTTNWNAKQLLYKNSQLRASFCYT